MMFVEQFLRWLLLLYGSIYFVTQSQMFSFVRSGLLNATRFGTGLYCSSCMGFWLGAGLALFGYWPYADHTHLIRGFEGGVSGMALGRVYAALLGDTTFKNELEALIRNAVTRGRRGWWDQ
jgi:hypothetical protein